ncbi:tripartite tricarboxylate transporter substrate binding protein [Desulfovibrio sp. OttesenSCG-928-O18]|nr:tripartite tricarboxylate transporter substrate binding protein [Desulfovibrio sp. OttesenSCG-928-O18]
MKRRITAILLLAAFLCLPLSAQGADWPNRPITIIAGYAAGGAHDAMSRMVVPHLEKVLGVKVIVKNAAGAGGTIGAAEVASAKPDGYTLFLTAAGPTITQPLVRKLPYSPDSFQLISQVYNSPHAIMVSKNSRFKKLEDFVKEAKARPGELIVGTVGLGGMNHLTLLDFCNAFGIKVKVMSERSGAEGMKNLAGGTLDGYVDTEGYIIRFDNQGLIRLWSERSKDPQLADVPCSKDFGKDTYWTTWAGFSGPKGIPADIVKKLDAAFAEVCKIPAFYELAGKNGYGVTYLPTAEFEKVFKNEWKRVIPILDKEGMLLK